jgi:tellurite methyltransferase
MTVNKSITFFDTQFQRQVAQEEFALNPFEKATLPFVSGRVLELGCGLGNLAIGEISTAVERVRSAAAAERLAIEAIDTDLETYAIEGLFDTIVAIGLLMFVRRPTALAMLRAIQEHVAPGGRAIVNVLVEGTTYMDMFDPDSYCLFGANELDERFAGWETLLSQRDSFDAPGNTRKEFATLVARKPAPQ